VYQPDDTVQTAPGTVVILPAPGIGNIAINGTNVVLSGNGGAPNGSYSVVTSTNLLLPLSSWLSVGSGVFDGNGGFTFTNATAPNSPQQFYRLQLP